MICDAHHHLWSREANPYAVEDLRADLATVPEITRTVFVECDAWYRTDGPEHLRVVGETEWVAAHADPLTEGIVGTADLRLGALATEVLEAHVEAGQGRFRGIRQRAVWDASSAIRPVPPETGPKLLLDPRFRDEFRTLVDMGLSFDAWVYFPQLPDVVDLARAFPEATIILNHLGGPITLGPYADREQTLSAWRPSMADVASCPNVLLKLGGIGMPIYGQDWHKRGAPATAEEVVAVWGEPIRWCIDTFGVDRCMFESNFPVDKLSMSYATIWGAFELMVDDASAADRLALFHDTAVRAYRLPEHTGERIMTDDVVDEHTPFVPEDDTYHVPTVDDPLWFETTWWSFAVPERRLGGWLHAGRHTNRGLVTWRVFVWDPSGADPGRLAYYRTASDIPIDDGVDLRDIAFPQGGFSVKMLTPLMDYHVAYGDGEARFSIEFEHRSVHPPHRFTPGEAPALHNPHLDQLGHLTGELVLDGERIPIDCYSVRDRAWGPRSRHHSHGQQPSSADRGSRVAHPGGARWREIERERGRGRIQYIFGHSWDSDRCDTGFLSFVRPQDGSVDGWSPLNMGWLLKDGEFTRLDKTRSRMKNYRDPDTGWSSHMEVELVDVGGRTMQAEGVALSHMCEHSNGSNASIRWEYDGKLGWGEDQDGWRIDHFARMRRALRAATR